MSLLNWPTALVALALAGCSSPVKGPGTAGADPVSEVVPAPVASAAGMSRVTSFDGSFSLLVPQDWIVASSKEPKFVAAVKGAGQAALLAQIDSLTKQSYMKLMVMDLKGVKAKSAFTDNFNVVSFPVNSPGGRMDMKTAANAAASQVFAPGSFTVSVLVTPNGEVGKYSGATSIGSVSKHDLIGGVLIRHGNALTFTLSTRLGNGKNVNQTFNTMMNSVKFK